MNNENIFTRDFLIALSNWQGGWANQDTRRRFADELVRQCENLPRKYKTVEGSCFRKRFILEGEVIPILIDDDFFEGIASWSCKKDTAKEFKGYVKANTKFAMLFKHKPLPNEVVVNIVLLWKDTLFKEAVKFLSDNGEDLKYLLGFKDSQHEIILKSTLKGTEIEDIVGISSSFEVLCDMAEISEENRRELSIKFARDPDGIPIEMPAFAGTRPTKRAIIKTLIKFRDMLETAKENNTLVDWSRVVKPHPEDLKYRP